VVRIGNAQVWGGRNVPSQMPGPASKLYAQNVVNLVTLMTARDEDGVAAFAPDFDDEIVSSSCVTRDGVIVHEPTREAIEVLPAHPRTAEPEPRTDDRTDPDDAVGREDAVDQVDHLDLPYDQEADQ
jgi:NAD(P) transhydrogenase subunit alpha